MEKAAFRAEMPVTQQHAYFDHAAVAPLPTGAGASGKPCSLCRL